MNLAKSPASTIQILGAEKALFRALKTKHDTPKYGLIYHASLVGQATGKNKGKIARMLAAKAAIGLRVDALSDWSAQGEGKGDNVDEEERSALGVLSRAKIERHLRGLEGKPLLPRGVTVGPNGKAVSTPGKWEVKEARKYNSDADGLAGDEPATLIGDSEKKSKKDKKKKLIEEIQEKPVAADDDSEDDSQEENSDDGDEESLQDSPKQNGSKSKPVTDSEEKSKKKAEKKAKEQRRAEREERKQKNAEKAKKNGAVEDPDEKKYGKLAEAAGISVAKYKRKAERGEIKLNPDGTPVVISKKDIKKQKKAEALASASGAGDAVGKKRKLEDDAEKSEKKKKKKSKN